MTLAFAFEPAGAEEAAAPDLDPELREQLRALGYLD